jgi:hypothetical protein
LGIAPGQCHFSTGAVQGRFASCMPGKTIVFPIFDQPQAPGPAPCKKGVQRFLKFSPNDFCLIADNKISNPGYPVNKLSLEYSESISFFKLFISRNCLVA